MGRAGRWERNALILAYITQLLVEFLRKVAGFYASHGDYFPGQAQLSPPELLLSHIWLWIEGWQGRFRARAQKKGWATGG